jgi:hypothetical protein
MSMEKLPLAAMAALLLALIGCAGAESKPQWTQAPDNKLAGHATFYWADRGGKPPVTILDNRIRSVLRNELTAKGYVEAEDDPDFLVSHETLERESARNGSPVRIGIGVGTRSGNVGGSVGTSVDVGDGSGPRQQLRVAVRALEPTDRREAWVGETAALAPQPEERALQRALGELMNGFPERQR